MKKYILLLLIFLYCYFGLYVIPDLTIIGYFNHNDGLGRQPYSLINAVKDLDLNINFLNSYKNKLHKKFDLDVYKAFFNPNKKMGKVIIYEDVLLGDEEPDSFDKRWAKWRSSSFNKINYVKEEDQVILAYSMLEGSRIPDSWVRIINKYFDAIIVPDNFLIEVYKSSGVTKPIFVIPLVLDLEKDLNAPLKEKRHKIFTFVNLSGIHPRKNHLQLIKAFEEAFGNDPNYRLIINGRYDQSTLANDLQEYIKSKNLMNIKVQKKNLSRNDYYSLMSEADCYISISLGEGFSIQPREAMARGIPVIVTDNTAQTTIARSGLVEAIESKLPIASKDPFMNKYDIGYYYGPKTKNTVQAMRNMVDNYDYYLSIAPKAREWARQYDVDHLKLRYQTMVKPKKIIFGKKNEITDEYIMTNDKNLYEKYTLQFSNTQM